MGINVLPFLPTARLLISLAGLQLIILLTLHYSYTRRTVSTTFRMTGITIKVYRLMNFLKQTHLFYSFKSSIIGPFSKYLQRCLQACTVH